MLSLRPKLSSPDHFRIQVGGGYPEGDGGWRTKDKRQRTEILVSNIRYKKHKTQKTWGTEDKVYKTDTTRPIVFVDGSGWLQWGDIGNWGKLETIHWTRYFWSSLERKMVVLTTFSNNWKFHNFHLIISGQIFLKIFLFVLLKKYINR